MRHPPFLPSPKITGRDTFCLAGAQRLAATIRAAWARCGHDVDVIVEEVAPGHPNTTWRVHMPNLVNGMPVR